MPQLESVFKSMPNNRFFLETDTDEQTIQEVYELAAQYKGLTIPQIQELVTINFSTIFGTRLNK
jgi:TatD DNase family protein